MYPMLPLEPAVAMQCIAALFTIFSAVLTLFFVRISATE